MIVQALQNQFSKRSAQPTGGGFFNWFGAATTKSGQLVNNNSALTLSAFYNGIEILCNDFAKLPKAVYQKRNGDRVKLDNHPVNYLISKRPNNLMTAFSFDKIMLQYAILKGNAYAIIERNSVTQKPIAFHVVEQEKTPVIVKKMDNRLWYHIGKKVYADYEILHVPGFSYNGITGVGVVTLAANSLGVSLASQNYAGEYYETKGVGIGVITSSKPINKDAKKRLSSATSKYLSDAGPWKVAVLDDAESFQTIKLTPQESQFLQTNANGVIEVARWLNIPPHKLKSLENATFSNIEHQEIQHVSDSILPWAKKFQNEYDVKVFSINEREVGMYCYFNEKSLLQADIQSQAEYFSKMWHIGTYTGNEIRRLLDLPAIEGLDKPYVPVNAQKVEITDLKVEELKLKVQQLQKQLEDVA